MYTMGVHIYVSTYRWANYEKLMEILSKNSKNTETSLRQKNYPYHQKFYDVTRETILEPLNHGCEQLVLKENIRMINIYLPVV